MVTEQRADDNPAIAGSPNIMVNGVIRKQFKTIILWGKLTAANSLLIAGVALVHLGYNMLQRHLAFYSLKRLLPILIVLILNLLLNYSLIRFCRQLQQSLADEEQEQFVQATAVLRRNRQNSWCLCEVKLKWTK